MMTSTVRMTTSPSNVAHHPRGRKVLRYPDRVVSSPFIVVFSNGAHITKRPPENCPHTRTTWRGGFHWDCIDCGQDVKDVDTEKRQTTFDIYLDDPAGGPIE